MTTHTAEVTLHGGHKPFAIPRTAPEHVRGAGGGALVRTQDSPTRTSLACGFRHGMPNDAPHYQQRSGVDPNRAQELAAQLPSGLLENVVSNEYC